MNKKHHSNNILLNLGIESLNEMQEVAQDAILNDNCQCSEHNAKGNRDE